MSHTRKEHQQGGEQGGDTLEAWRTNTPNGGCAGGNQCCTGEYDGFHGVLQTAPQIRLASINGKSY